MRCSIRFSRRTAKIAETVVQRLRPLAVSEQVRSKRRSSRTGSSDFASICRFGVPSSAAIGHDLSEAALASKVQRGKRSGVCAVSFCPPRTLFFFFFCEMFCFHARITGVSGVGQLGSPFECCPNESAKTYIKGITLGGGSLGSCVDEERSQLRELM